VCATLEFSNNKFFVLDLLFSQHSKKTVSISPNQYSSHFNINVVGQHNTLRYSLKDIHGRIVKKGVYPEVIDAVKVNTDDLPAGVYVLVTEVDNKITTVKTVKL
jgi:hypothetical protein